MALVTPQGIPLVAFDASNGATFKFVVQGGDQVVGNIITIRNNTNNQVVYTNEVTSYLYEQTIPSAPTSGLMDGEVYNFTFKTRNANGDYSSESSPIVFYCFATPIITLTNIPTGTPPTIESATYSFVFTYLQANDPVNTFTVYLYDAAHNQIDSKTYYNPTEDITTFTHSYNGFIDDEKYYLKITAVTKHGTIITKFNNIEELEFLINYSYDESYFNIKAENFANGGFVQIINNVSEVDGKMVDGSEPQFLGDSYVVLEDQSILRFDDGFQIKSDGFVKQKWWFPRMLGETAKFYNNSGDYIKLSLQRGIDGNNNVKDYILMEQYCSSTNQYKYKTSNLINPINNLAQVISYLKIDENNVTLTFGLANITSSAEWNGESSIILDGMPSSVEWEGEGGSSSVENNIIDIDTGESNVEFGAITNMFWADEQQAPVLTEYNDITFMPTVYYSDVDLRNSIINEFYITRNTNQSQMSSFPTWDNYTVMLCEFNNNVLGGNITWVLGGINKIKLKRKLTRDITNHWVTLFEKDINSADDLSFNYRDYFVPSGDNFTYAMIPCQNEDEQSTELTYNFTAQVDTFFNGLFICDKDKTLKLYSNYGITSSQTNALIGVLQPYQQVFPTTVKNPYVQYRTVTIDGDVLGLNNVSDDDNCTQSNFQLTEETRPIIVSEKLEWDKFLCNGKTKIIKDWNGNIMMAQITVFPSYSYDKTSGNSKPTMSFGATEVGIYDNQSHLYEHGLINIQA